MSRVSLKKLVATLVDKWSLEYLQLAKLGDLDAVMTVAEIQFSKTGYGQIGYNPVQGRRWIEVAASKGDINAINTLKRLTLRAKEEKEYSQQVRRYQIGNLEKPKLGLDAADNYAKMTRTGKYATDTPNLAPLRTTKLDQTYKMIESLEERTKVALEDNRKKSSNM